MNIRVGNYTTMDGTPARVYATDGTPGAEVHGALWNDEHQAWDSTYWNAEGIDDACPEHSLDELVPERTNHDRQHPLYWERANPWGDR